MYVYFNPNPAKKIVGDCVIRGICKLIGDDWETTYTHIIVQGYKMFDMPSSNSVWGTYLKNNGYLREVIPCSDMSEEVSKSHCTIKDFCRKHPKGKYLVATGSHVVAVVNGDYYDTWDSGDEIPIYFWRKEELDE